MFGVYGAFVTVCLFCDAVSSVDDVPADPRVVVPPKAHGIKFFWDKIPSLFTSKMHSEFLLWDVGLTFFLPWRKSPSEPRPPDYRRFVTKLRHTTLGRTPLDEWSVRLREIYLRVHIYKKDIFAPGEIRTHSPADPRLRPRGHWDRLW
jgi:hypothetical protein